MGEERVDADVEARQRGREASRGAIVRPRASRLHGHDRLLARHLRNEPGERAGIPEALQVEQHHARARVVRPVCEQVVARHVRPVARGHERRDAEVQAADVIEDGEAERPALREHADGSGRGPGGGEGGVERHGGIGVQHAHAVRSDQPHARAAHELDQLALELGPGRRRVGEARRDDDHAVDVGARAVADHVEHGRRGHGDDGQVDALPDRLHRRMAAQPGDGLGVRVHRVDRSGEAGTAQVVDQHRPDRAGRARRADDGDRPRRQDRAQAARRGGALALLRDGGVLVGLAGRKGDVEDPVGERALHAEAALGEDPEHAVVLAEDVGLELRDAAGAGDHDEVLEEQRAEPAALERVTDRERHLGAMRGDRRAVGHGIARGRDDALRVADPPRRHERAAGREVELRERFELLVGEALLHAKEAEVDGLGAELGEAARELRTVAGTDRADVHRRAVTQDAVDGVVLPGGRHGRRAS